MRSRPKIRVFYEPRIVHPGDSVKIDVELVSRSETPVDSIEVSLVGRESAVVGFGQHRRETSHDHVALRARFQKDVLKPSKHIRAARYEIPMTAPPTHRGTNARIDYAVDVHVHIPWWPDARASFLLNVTPRPVDVAPSPSGLLCTSLAGPQRDSIYMEASLDRTVVAPGETFAGQCAVINTRGARLSGLRIAMVARERAVAPARMNEGTAARYELPLREGFSESGEPIAFQVRVPEEAASTYTGALSALEWHVELAAVVTWGRDVVLRIPIEVRPSAGGAAKRVGSRGRAAPVGSDRRARLWAAVAERAGMTYDPQRGRMERRAGDVSLEIALEEIRGEGTFTTATLAWPPIGVDLDVRPQKLLDALKRKIELGDKAFDQRFHVQAREAAQVLPLLGKTVRATLLAFEDARVTDDGARLTSTDAGQMQEPLERFVKSAVVAADAFHRALGRVPPPLAMQPFVAAWQALAAEVRGRFEPGRVWIHRGDWSGVPVEMGTLWSTGALVEGTLLRVRLDPPLEGPVNPADEKASLSRAAKLLITEITESSAALGVGPDSIDVTLAAATLDPAELRPLFDRMARLAAILLRADSRGPYR